MNRKGNYQEQLNQLHQEGYSLEYISGKTPIDHNADLSGNIENFIGYTQVPVGLAGPLLLDGTSGKKEHWIPMATTEGALVASYSRGIKAGNLCGGFVSRTVATAVQRCPYFEFDNVISAIAFAQWCQAQIPLMQQGVKMASRFAELINVSPLHEGNAVHLTFDYQTGAAAGQNMVTLVTAQIVQHLLEHAPHKPTQYYIEGNISGDKKANTRSLTKVRGKKVIAEVLVTRDVISTILKSSADNIVKFWQTGTLAAVHTGAVGNHGHITNALTSIFLACGQDVACIAEAAVGVERMEVKGDGDLYATLSLPGLIVGTVGGGTKLPTQQEALSLMDCARPEDADRLAEICCAVALAGELSIGAAIAEGHFAAAHATYGRKKTTEAEV